MNKNELKKIINGINKISAGDFSAPLKISSNNSEFDQLASSLNDMSLNLKNIMKELKDFSNDRVSELSTAIVLLEKKMAERNELEEMWKRYEFIINTSKYFMTMINTDYIYQAVNDAYCTVHNKKREDVINKPVAMVWGKNIFEEVIKEYLDKCFEGNEVNQQEWFNFGTLGKRFMHVTYYPYFNKENIVTNAIVVSRDITEEKLNIDELRISKEELVELNKTLNLEISERKETEKELKETTSQLIQSEKLSAIGELSASIMHELNQPMNNIKIICQSIVRDIERDSYNLSIDELKDDLVDIDGQIDRMTFVFEYMRNFSRKSDELTKIKINLNDLIIKSSKILEQQFKNNNIKLLNELAKESPFILGNEIQIEQVLINFLSNSRHAVENNSKDEKKVIIRTFSDIKAKEVILEVEDNGKGISKKDVDKIYKPFFTTKEVGKGTGLGLSISKRIIEIHGGRIEIKKNDSKGIIFNVCFPVYK